MEQINYIDGEYYPSRGGYYHICIVCTRGFFGRENKIHCSDKCRYHKNNKKSRNKKLETRKEFKQIALINEVLKTYYPASKGKTPISVDVLTNKQLDFTLMTRITKDEKSGLIMYQYLDYSFSHNKENKTIIIYKIDE